MSDLCEWYSGYTAEAVLKSPYSQMMTLYDYGCEKRYGKPVPRAEKTEMTSRAEVDATRARIEAAARRAGVRE